MQHLEFETSPEEDEEESFINGNSAFDSPAMKHKGKKSKLIIIQNSDEGINRRILCIMLVLAIVGGIAHYIHQNPPSGSISIEINRKNNGGVDEGGEVATNSETTTTTTTTAMETTTTETEEEAEEEEEDIRDSQGRISRTYSHLSTMEPDPLKMHATYNETYRSALKEKWGYWHFWDGEEDNRGDLFDDYCAKYPNRDIPSDDFPDDAWQVDAVYVNHILNDADQLITRAMEAIFTEYGNGKPLASAEMYAIRRKMFHWDKFDSLAEMDQPPEAFRKHGNRGNGGWTTKRSFDGLVRRILHAMMTNDSFTVVLGGHSAAAGHGNHFRQSYMMQFHQILSPIFSRLGIKLVTRNMAQGGLGTIHSSLGSSSIYGDEIDLLLWDSGMTEGSLKHQIDLFMRQGLLGGNRVPVIWGGNFDILKFLHDKADIDIGEIGWGMDGIKETTSDEQAKTLPYAMRYMKCSEESQELCKDNKEKFCSTCWIPRSDGITPSQEQYETPHGRVKWHPGWRSHQLQGRVLAFSVLDALQMAVQIFSEQTMGGPPLGEEMWHVTEYYENMRTKLKALMDEGDCKGMFEINHLPKRLCNTPMKAFTQYTPRANFESTALTSIIKPAENGYVPKNNKKALYDGPDAHNTCFDLPLDTDPLAVDVRAIVAGRRQRRDRRQRKQRRKLQHLLTTRRNFTHIHKNNITTMEAAQQHTLQQERRRNDEIVPGKGWQVIMEPQGVCDGTYNAICARSTDHPCVLYGHHDERGSIVGSELSGWLVMTLPQVKEGLILIKVHTWHYESENPRTEGWTTVNDDKRQRLRSLTEYNTNGDTLHNTTLSATNRELWRSVDTPELCDEFGFDYAIDGKITSLSKAEFMEKKQDLQRVVEVLTLLDDPNYASEPKDVEVAVRLRGCGRKVVFGVSHLYYA